MDGIERISAERRRQIDAEGWTPEHDDQHQDSELAFAACYYAMPCMIREDGVTFTPDRFFEETGWDEKWAKRDKKGRIHRLAVAGALIAAEIDRLIRAGGEE